MTGLVYGRVVQREGMTAGLRKILARAAALYALTATLTILFTVFSERTTMPWAKQIDLGDPLAFLFSIFALQRSYFLVDVLLLYTFLFLCAPPALALFNRGKGWLVLVISGLIYGLYQFFPNLMVLPWPIEGNGLFNFAAWQAIFFAALGGVFGWLQPDRELASGETIADLRGVYIEPDTPPGRYTLFVGLVNPETGQRIKLISGADRFELGKVTVR